ncbi:MAG: hypothetical protein ABI383_00990 [Acidobacteriaceae bacterium]
MAISTLSDVAEQIHKYAEEILQRTCTLGDGVSDALNDVLRTFVGWPYAVGPISIRELKHTGDAMFQSAIYTSAMAGEQEGATPVDAVKVACVFHTATALTIEELTTGYRRIGAVKRLKRPSPTGIGYPVNNTPLGVIFCIESESSLEMIAENIVEINKTVPSTEWPDIILVLRRGTVNYAVQFEGDKIRGDFLLPNSDDFPVTPMYVHVFARALGLHSLNRLFSFLFLHLQIFSPGIKLPNEAAVEDISTMGMTLGAYQFNLKRQLVPFCRFHAMIS